METRVPRGRPLGMSLGTASLACRGYGLCKRGERATDATTLPGIKRRPCRRRVHVQERRKAGHKRAEGWLSTRSRTSGLPELHSAGPHFPQLRARDPRPLQVPCRAGVPTLEAGALVFLVAADDVSSARRTRPVLLALEVAVHRVAIDRRSTRIADHLDAAPDTVAVDA